MILIRRHSRETSDQTDSTNCFKIPIIIVIIILKQIVNYLEAIRGRDNIYKQFQRWIRAVNVYKYILERLETSATTTAENQRMAVVALSRLFIKALALISASKTITGWIIHLWWWLLLLLWCNIECVERRALRRSNTADAYHIPMSIQSSKHTYPSVKREHEHKNRHKQTIRRMGFSNL